LSQDGRDTRLSVGDLRLVAATILQRAGAITAGVDSIRRMGIRYLRMKPDRGLVLSFGALTPGSQTGFQLLTIMVGEDEVEGTRLRFGWREVETAGLVSPSPNIVHAPGLSLSVQVFPADAKLPALAASCDTSPNSPIFSSIEAAAKVQLNDAKWSLASLGVEPLRYKMGNRCVLAYNLRGADERSLVIIGKLYADPARARLVHENLSDLHSRFDADVAIVPRPLGIVDSLGLTYTEAIVPSRQASSGSPTPQLQPSQIGSPWRPRVERASTGALTFRPPSAAIRLAGVSLARLHGIRPGTDAQGTLAGTAEADQVRKRVERLVSWQPAEASTMSRLGEQLAARLDRSVPDRHVTAHGSYKRTQVIPDGDRVYVIDFDSMCIADPALDVGCFLAYLRPREMYYQRERYADWFEAAAAQFVQGYREAVLSDDSRSSAADGILERARLFEASRLFKIATRRINRLNSPRPAELRSICNQIADCLNSPGRWL
jgi:Phosphotransferase enzyme family